MIAAGGPGMFSHPDYAWEQLPDCNGGADHQVPQGPTSAMHNVAVVSSLAPKLYEVHTFS